MTSVTLNEAKTLIAAEQQADKIGQPMNIAVIDAGGVPLKRDGVVVGDLGVSGGTGEQDQSVAEAGVAAL